MISLRTRTLHRGYKQQLSKKFRISSGYSENRKTGNRRQFLVCRILALITPR